MTIHRAYLTCKNRGNQFTGNFCNRCGEKVYTDHDKSVSHFLKTPLIIIPLSALPLWLSGWKKRRFFFNHLLLSTEINCFYLTYAFFLIPLLSYLIVFIQQAVAIQSSPQPCIAFMASTGLPGYWLSLFLSLPIGLSFILFTNSYFSAS